VVDRIEAALDGSIEAEAEAAAELAVIDDIPVRGCDCGEGATCGPDSLRMARQRLDCAISSGRRMVGVDVREGGCDTAVTGVGDVLRADSATLEVSDRFDVDSDAPLATG
jgi:hypothetical protein